jgi:hypothetical protein
MWDGDDGYRYYKPAASQHGERVNRAFNQPLHVQQCRYYSQSHRWELRVLSSNGYDFYRVRFNTSGGSCTCPDFSRRGKPCKHMLTVLLRILRLQDNKYTTIKQVGKSYDHITQSLLALYDKSGQSGQAQTPAPAAEVSAACDEPVSAAQDKKKRKHKTDKDSITDVTATTSAVDPGAQQSSTTKVANAGAPEGQDADMCCICLMDFDPNIDNTLTRCTADCKKLLGHHDCLQTWFVKSTKCPFCNGAQAKKKRGEDAQEGAAAGGDDVFFAILDA